MSNMWRESSRTSKKKEMRYMKKTNELETKSKGKNTGHLYEGTNEFKKSFQHRTNLVKD